MPAAAQEHDEPLLIALSTQRIEIDSNFAGTSILLFGATDVAGDVVVSVRGPEEPIVVRRKLRSVGVWVNQEAIAFRNVPGYYFVATSSPLEDIAPEEFLRSRATGLEPPAAGGDLVRHVGRCGRVPRRPAPPQGKRLPVQIGAGRGRVHRRAAVPHHDRPARPRADRGLPGGGDAPGRRRSAQHPDFGDSPSRRRASRRTFPPSRGRTRPSTASLLSRSRWWQDGWAASPSARAEDAAGSMP